MTAYSFLDVQAAIIGPGGSFSLGSDSGAAKEGISVSMLEEKNTMVVGADGTPMHSLRASKAGRITVRLLKTSPVNSKLSAMYSLQTLSSAAHGTNVITLKNNQSGDSITALQCAFSKLPDLSYAEESGINEWVFDAGIIDTTLGGGLAVNLASLSAGLV